MAATTTSARTRDWADFLAILTGVALVGLSIWPGGITFSNEAEAVIGYPALLWLARAAAGGAAIAAVLLAQRWERRGAARALLVGGAGLLLLALLMFRDFGARALLMSIVPAAALLVAAVGVGPASEGR